MWIADHVNGKEDESKGFTDRRSVTMKVSWPFSFGWGVVLSKCRACRHLTFHQQASILEVDSEPTKYTTLCICMQYGSMVAATPQV